MTVHNPGLHFSEESFVQTLCDPFFGQPTPEEAFYNIQVVYTWEDHRLKLKDHEKNEERSRKNKEDIEFVKEALQGDVRLADKGSKYYDELMRDLTDFFGQESLLTEILLGHHQRHCQS